MGLPDPANVRIYGNGGRMLPLMNNETRKDDLLEMPIFMEKGGDGVFNENDYILFYAEGPVTWKYNTDEKMFLHSVHGFSYYSCYFVTSSPGGKKLKLFRY
ncbi:MAG: hypothetical protein HC906_03350 [Bacteroidales bacterium]|nr:hypothetical protein [Bacteroidales bacterium]